MLEHYIAYLNFLTGRLTRFFDKQKPYIFCKKGCGLCCQNAQFPYSQIEFEYLMKGFEKLDSLFQEKVTQNIKNIIEAKNNFTGEKFKYNCPFLVDNVCSVYEYRGIVCRAFGLMNLGENGGKEMPFCCFKGLNYSNIMEGKYISAPKYRELGVSEPPLAFNVSYDFLTDAAFEKLFDFKFGDKMPMIDWFIKSKKMSD